MFLASTHNLNSTIGDKPVLINNAPIPGTRTFTCLGVELDGKLNWEKHIDSICQKVSAGIGIMRRIKPYVSSKTLQDIYNRLVMPYFDYCSPLQPRTQALHCFYRDQWQLINAKRARVLGQHAKKPSAQGC